MNVSRRGFLLGTVFAPLLKLLPKTKVVPWVGVDVARGADESGYHLVVWNDYAEVTRRWRASAKWTQETDAADILMGRR